MLQLFSSAGQQLGHTTKHEGGTRSLCPLRALRGKIKECEQADVPDARSSRRLSFAISAGIPSGKTGIVHPDRTNYHLEVSLSRYIPSGIALKNNPPWHATCFFLLITCALLFQYTSFSAKLPDIHLSNSRLTGVMFAFCLTLPLPIPIRSHKTRQNMDKHQQDTKQDTNEEFKGDFRASRRGFMQFVGISVGMMGASLLSHPAEGGSRMANTADKVVPASAMVQIHLLVNENPYTVLVEPRWSLLYVLREIIGLSGTKMGCDRGECGACTVLINEVPRYSCLTLAVEAENRRITTVEGLMNGEELGPVQTAFVENDAFQCGYCTPGQIMAVEGLLRRIEKPSSDEIRRGCSGNLCRCGAYQNIFAAADEAARLKNT